MNVLGIDGALDGFSAGVARDGEVVATVVLDGNVALEAGLRAVRDVMETASLSAETLDRIAVGIGPGRFTGLRITIAYAKALAQAWNVPLAGISSFDLLEYGLQSPRVLSVVVGRPGVISARYREGDEVRRASGAPAEVLAHVLPSKPGDSLDVIGASEDVLAYLAEGGFTVNRLLPLVTPPAAALALAGADARVAASLHEVRADYGEAPAAKVPTFKNTERRTR
jgi:tRNA threonylcarbamoyladenosine biosynthesis protein TsaB